MGGRHDHKALYLHGGSSGIAFRSSFQRKKQIEVHGLSKTITEFNEPKVHYTSWPQAIIYATTASYSRDTRLPSGWKMEEFKRAWNNYSLPMELNYKKSEPMQVAMLLTVIGEEVRDVFLAFTDWTAGDDS